MSMTVGMEARSFSDKIKGVIATGFLLQLLTSSVTCNVFPQAKSCVPGPLDPLSLARCDKKGYAMRCNGTNQKNVPSSYPPHEPPLLCLLDLSSNNIRYVNSTAFISVLEIRLLDLSDNNISVIASEAFEGLSQLIYLNLLKNVLAWPDSFGKGVFSPLTNLEFLNLKLNKIKTFEGLDKEIQCLKNLKGLSINGCPNCTLGPGFQYLEKLSNVSFSGYQEKECQMPIVKNSTFKNLPQIERLWIDSCKINRIEANSFSHFKRLKLLDISYNENLTFAGMNLALYGLRNSPTLTRLIANKIHETYGLGTMLKAENVTNLITLRKLEMLHLDLNKLEVFDEKIFHPDYKLPQSLRRVTLAGNRITIGNYAKHLNAITNVTYIDISRQHLGYDPFRNKHNEPEKTQLFRTKELPTVRKRLPPIGIPRDLRVFIWRQSFVRYISDLENLTFYGTDNLQKVDLSFNLMMTWKGKIIGLNKLSILDLSENYCHDVSPTFFHSFEGLTHLNITGNFLGRSFKEDNANITFEKQMKLVTLDLSTNEIDQLPENVFQNLQSLQYLNLSGNRLDNIGFSLNTNLFLRYLDLAGNKLRELPEHITCFLDKIANSLREENVTVDISHNPLECDCHTLPFLRWMSKTKVVVKLNRKDQCQLSDGKRYRIINYKNAIPEIIHILERECAEKSDKTWLWVVGFSILTLLVSVLIYGSVYRYRWRLRYLYYSRHQRHVQKGFERLYENDAFVSYSTSKCGFVKNQMVPHLEQQHGMKLWISDRDSRAGVCKAENIVHSINNSRKTILLVDSSYLKDSWCDYEMNMARIESIESKRPVIIFVLFDNISSQNLPISIVRLLQSEENFVFPKTSHPQEMEAFWKALCDAANV